jgi:hypothetical protein
MWSLWPQLIACFHEWAVDYLENLIVPLDNFISRGTPHFLAGTSPNYLQQACHPLQISCNCGIPAACAHCFVHFKELLSSRLPRGSGAPPAGSVEARSLSRTDLLGLALYAESTEGCM